MAANGQKQLLQILLSTAVFSIGSIAWSRCLADNAYSNDVARITNNVVRRFLDPKPFEAPSAYRCEE